jgi:TolA-binding protein
MMWRAIFLLAAGALGGCSAPPWQSGSPTAPATTPAGLEVYLDTLDALVRASPEQRLAIYDRVASEYRRTPTTTNRLRFALVLSTPGHAAADPEEAARILSHILQDPVGLLPLERSLARVQLQHAEALAQLETQNRRLAATVEELHTQNTRVATRELEAATQENMRLRAALAEAEAKLEAIRTIERAVLERDEPATEPR